MATSTRRTPNAAIIARREELDDELAAAREAVEIIGVKLQNLQRRCKHPNAVLTSHMGESCRHCYDCGRCP